MANDVDLTAMIRGLFNFCLALNFELDPRVCALHTNGCQCMREDTETI